MQRETAASASSPMSIFAILGGAVAAVGVFLSWGEVTGASIGGSIFGQEIPSQSLGASDLADLKKVADLSFTGLSSTAGILLLVGGAIAIVGGLLRMTGSGDGARRIGSLVAAVGGILAIAMAALAFATRGTAGTDAFFSAMEDAAKADPQAAAALGASGVDMGQALDFLRDFVTVETSIGIGFIVSAAGAVVAVLAGVMMLAGARAPAVSTGTMDWAPPGGGFVPESAAPLEPAPPAEPPAPETTAEPPAAEPPPADRPGTEGDS